uniref:Uncharacterized protein n=1 Tax=Tanacetum cinerariifolium TaxID=118510 RepID=A0A699H270_TANCI|nr:hypothetical protein [Tanacetum cinerariifolium]
MPQPMQNLDDSSDPTTAMNKALALMVKAFKFNTIPTNNNQRSSLIPCNSQIAQPDINTSQNIKIQMVDDNVGNLVRQNTVQNDGKEVRQNAIHNPGIQNVENMNGLSVVLETTNKYGNGNVVTIPAEGNGNGISVNPQQLQISQEEEARIQSTQEEFEFMTTADAHEEIKRVKVNCTSKDTLQQASTSETQSDNAPICDLNRSTKLRAQLFDKVYEQKGTNKCTRTNTMFTKQSILGKPPSSSYKPKLYSVTPFLKSSVLPKVDKTNALSKSVTSNTAPSIRESKVMQTVNVIALRIFRTNPSKTSNDVPNKPVKTSVRIKTITILQPNVIHKQQANSDSNGFSYIRVNNIAKTRRPHPRSNSNTDKVPSKYKSSCLSNNVKKIKENHRNSQIPKNQNQNRRDLPRNTPLDRVEVLGLIEKMSKVRKGIVSTEIELVLEQIQQGTSHDVSISTEWVEEWKRIVRINGEKKEALHTTLHTTLVRSSLRLPNNKCALIESRANEIHKKSH